MPKKDKIFINEVQRQKRFLKKKEKPESFLKGVKDYFLEMKTPKGNEYRQITVNNYISKINKILGLLDKTDFKIDYLLDSDLVINKLKDKYNNFKDYISPIVKLLTYFNNNNEYDNIIKSYRDAMNGEKKKEDDGRANNKLKKKDENKFISLSEIKKKIDDYKIDNDPERLKYLLVINFYFGNIDNLIPRNDLNILKLININKIKNMNNEYNYIVMKGTEPDYMVWNNYKTSTTYGKQKFNISDDLKALLKTYIDINNIDNGDFLFTNNKDINLDKTGMLRLISKATKDILGFELNIDLIRSIVITDFYSSLKSINQKNEFAKRLLHSSDIAQEYIKISNE
jgi:hypothetical protein